MQTEFIDRKAPKKSTNLSINSDLLRQARKQRIKLSQVLELRLIELLREEKVRSWRKGNHEAIEEYNQRIASTGVFSDRLRRF